MRGDSGLPMEYLGTVRDDGAFALDKAQSVAGVSFFADPVNGVPSLMLGVHALRKIN